LLAGILRYIAILHDAGLVAEGRLLGVLLEFERDSYGESQSSAVRCVGVLPSHIYRGYILSTGVLPPNIYELVCSPSSSIISHRAESSSANWRTYRSTGSDKCLATLTVPGMIFQQWTNITSDIMGTLNPPHGSSTLTNPPQS